MSKMTDEQIKKALECCTTETCWECPFEPKEHRKGTIGCCEENIKSALDLINRQQTAFENSIKATKHWHREAELNAKEIIKLQAEIERLKNSYKQCAYERDVFLRENPVEMALLIDEQAEKLKTIKAEAIKEFASEIINDLLPKIMVGYDEKALQISLAISNKAKEMVGEGK